MGWNQTLNTEKVKVIREILIDLQKVDELFFPRHILHEHSELHVFADAASRAYGVAAYTVNHTHQCSDLLISKARVAPCREDHLTASLIGARLIRYLSNLFKFDTIYLCSDSKVTISWITSDRDVKDVYIANRVAEIKTLINHHHVNVMYVPTKDKPADHLSQGCTSKQLKIVIGCMVLHGSSLVNSRNSLILTSS